MPDIGATLREARMARRLDITEVEAATKIRAKYLRALENEEWELLPGPTFVRTFLRTYGDYLELDSRMLVEDYKQSFQRPSQQDLVPFAGGPGGSRSTGRGRPARGGRGIPPVALVGLVVLVLLGALFALGTLGGGDDGDDTAATPTPSATATDASGDGGSGDSAAERRQARRERAARERRAAAQERAEAVVRFTAIATGEVNVCLVSGTTGRVIINGETLSAGERTRTVEARDLRVTFGNNAVELRVDGEAVDIPASSSPIGYRLQAGEAPEPLPAERQPTCG